jgi:hypothetical protein
MTTRYYFFTKLFDENDKSKHLYKNIDFDNMSPNQLYLLDKLSILSKYKNYIKGLLLRRKLSDREKVNYIQLYKPNLTYPEYINFNIMIEEDENSFINSLYIAGVFSFISYIYLISKNEPNQSIFKGLIKAAGLSILAGYGFNRFYKITFRKRLDEIYMTLENRLNEFPEMKKNSQNKNYLTEENYDEELEEKF